MNVPSCLEALHMLKLDLPKIFMDQKAAMASSTWVELQKKKRSSVQEYKAYSECSVVLCSS